MRLNTTTSTPSAEGRGFRSLRRCFGPCSWLPVAILLLVNPAQAQEVAGPAAGPDAGPFYEALIRTPILPMRAAADIQADFDVVDKDLRTVEREAAAAQARIQEADGWLSRHKVFIDDVKAKTGAAKKDKREADKVALEAQQKQLELVQDYLKRMKSLREAELDLARAQKDMLNAQSKALRAEDELRKKYEAIKAAGPKDPGIVKLVLETATFGQTTMQFVKAAAEKNTEVTGRARKLADRRVDLAEARNKVLTEDRIRKAVEAMGN